MSQSRGAMRSTEESRLRWVPVVVLLTALGILCALLGAYFVAPLLGGDHSPSLPPETQMAAAPQGPPGRPAVVFPSGQGTVRIEEKPVPAPAPPEPKDEEPGISTSIQSVRDDTASGDTAASATDEPKEEGERGKRGSRRRGDASAAGSVQGDTPETAAPAEGARSESPTTEGAPPASGNREPAKPETGPAVTPASGPAPGTGSTPGDAGASLARPSGPMYRVQVGHFAEEKDAQALKEELGRIGYAPSVVRSTRDGQTLYRVQIATYRRRENADKTIEQLRQRQFEPYLAEDEP
jgi:cell division septation protein DedD